MTTPIGYTTWGPTSGRGPLRPHQVLAVNDLGDDCQSDPNVVGDKEASTAAGDAAAASGDAESDRLLAAARDALGDYSQAQQAHAIRDIANWNIRRLAERYLASIAHEGGYQPSTSITIHCFGEGWRDKPSFVLEGRC